MFSITTFFYGQAQKIESEKVFGDYKFSLNGKNLSRGELKTLMQPNPEAYQLMSTAKTQITTATILATIGGGLMGWEIVDLISGKKSNWSIFGSGAAIALIAFPIGSAGEKKALKAVDLYNAGLKTTSWKAEPTLNLTTRGNGIGFVLTF